MPHLGRVAVLLRTFVLLSYGLINGVWGESLRNHNLTTWPLELPATPRLQATVEQHLEVTGMLKSAAADLKAVAMGLRPGAVLPPVPNMIPAGPSAAPSAMPVLAAPAPAPGVAVPLGIPTVRLPEGGEAD